MEPVSETPTPNPPVQVAVVGPEYCRPYNMDLTVTRDLGGDFTVTDVNGSVMMKSKDQHVIVDAHDNPIISLQKQKYEKWVAFRGDSSDSQDLLFGVKNQPSPFDFDTLDVFLSANTNANYCDFKIKRDFFMETSSTVYHGNSDNIVARAKMDNEFTLVVLLGKDTYRLTVYPNVDYAFVVALIVILIKTKHDAKFAACPHCHRYSSRCHYRG